MSDDFLNNALRFFFLSSLLDIHGNITIDREEGGQFKFLANSLNKSLLIPVRHANKY